jgi:hypothetical protein
MRDASQNPDRQGFSCAACGRLNITAVEGLFRRPHAGSAQRFCDPACRQAAYRRRQAGVQENTPRQLRGGRGRRLTTRPKLAGLPATTKPQTPRSTSEEAV